MKIRIMSGYALSTLVVTQDSAGVLPVQAPGPQLRQIGTLYRAGDGWRFACGAGCTLIRLYNGGVQTLQESSALLQPGVPCQVQTGLTELVQLLAEPDPLSGTSCPAYAMPRTGTVTVGSGAGAAIRWTGFGGAEELFTMQAVEGGVRVTKTLLDSPWNLYGNDVCFVSTVLHSGDWLYCAGLRILIGPGMLRCCVSSGELRCTLAPAQPAGAAALPPHPEHNTYFHIAPAEALLPVREQIQVAAPPEEPEEQEQGGLLMTMLPGIMMALAMLITCVLSVTGSGTTNLTTLISGMVMVVCMVIGCIMPVFTRRRQRRLAAQRRLTHEKEYREYLERLSRELAEEAATETFNLQLRNPPLEGESLSLPLPGGKGNRQVASCAMRASRNGWKGLWERKPSDPDFLQVAVGTGDLAPVCTLQCPQPPAVGKIPPLYQEMEEKLQQTPSLENVPVTLDLRANRIIGLVGRQRSSVLNQALGLITELTTLHSYENLRLVVIHSEAETAFWRFAAWMPHIWKQDGSMRFLANDAGEIKSLSQSLQEVIAQRRSRDSETKAGPWFVIINADPALGRRAEAIRELYAAQEDLRMTVIELCGSEKELPRNCTAILDTDRQVLSLRDGSTAREQVLTSLLPPLRQSAEALYRNMSHIRLQDAEQAHALPEKLSFLDMMQVGSAEQLNIRRRWRDSDPIHSMAVTLGQDSDGFPVLLDIHEKAHGPHGLVAGMTGSGKSELLISFILGMAIQYRPDEVSFILIDFKGGGMADVFRTLPHLAGSITNLDGGELRRSFLAIESELEHRQQIFQQTTRELQLNSVDIYSYQKLYRQHRVSQPLPHLIIISDEFAELKNQQGDFMEQLIRIARIGRSLGVHLVLATQKPDGIVNDQIKSNIRYKICLKVQDKGDSTAMIDRPDAAALTQPGRFYLQVGMDEVFELGQSGYTGVPYQPKLQYEPPKGETVRLLDEQGRVCLAGAPKLQLADPDRKQISAVLEEIGRAAAEEGFSQRFIWAPPLAVVERAAQQNDEKERLRVRVGTYDDLYARAHKPLYVSLSQQGGAVVYGASGSGKGEFVTRVLLGCMEQCTPEQVQFYLADADAGTLQPFAKSEYTAYLAMPGEYDRFGEMLDKLTQELEERRALLQPFGGNAEAYLAAGNTLPQLVCVVHGSAGFFAGDNSDVLVSALRTLCRTGLKYGITVLVTAVDDRSLHYSITALLPQVFVLRQTDEEAYDMLLGRTRGIRPAEGLGRGLIRVGHGRDAAVYEFQVDIPFVDAANPYEALTETVQEKNTGKKPKKVPAQKQEVSPFLPMQALNEIEAGWESVPLALDDEENPIFWNFREEPFLPCSTAEEPALVQGLTMAAARGCGESAVLVLDGTGTLPQTGKIRVVHGKEIGDAVRTLRKTFLAELSAAAAAYQSTGEMPEMPRHLVVLNNVLAVIRQLERYDTEALQLLNSLLSFKRNSDRSKTPLAFLVLYPYSDELCELPDLESLRPIEHGLVLSLPPAASQTLFRCPELSGRRAGTGLVQDGRLTPCSLPVWGKEL